MSIKSLSTKQYWWQAGSLPKGGSSSHTKRTDGLRPNSEQKRYRNNALSDDTTSALQRMKRADAVRCVYARLYAAQTNAA